MDVATIRYFYSSSVYSVDAESLSNLFSWDYVLQTSSSIHLPL